MKKRFIFVLRNTKRSKKNYEYEQKNNAKRVGFMNMRLKKNIEEAIIANLQMCVTC